MKITVIRKNHKESAVTKAYEAHSGALKRFISRILGNQQDVDEILQEAFFRAYAAEKGKSIEEPKPYLFRTAKHVALNHIKKQSIRPTDYLEDQDSITSGEVSDTLEDEIMAQQKLEIHCAAVATLPPQCRKIYLMCKVYGMSYQQIAEELNITISTVKSHLEKAFSRCQTYVEKHLGDEYTTRVSRPGNRGADL